MNLRPPGYEPDELPTALRRDIWTYGGSPDGAGGRARTGTVSLPRDFKSLVSTNSTTPANIGLFRIPQSPAIVKDFLKIFLIGKF